MRAILRMRAGWTVICSVGAGVWLAAQLPGSGQRILNDGWVAAYEPVDRVFQRQCVRCHNSQSPAHGVDLSSYDKVMHGREAHGPLVAVGNPDASVMMQALRGRTGRKLNGTSPHVRAVGRFDERDLQTIEAWMKNGAQPNGSRSERLSATLRLYVVALDDGQQGYFSAHRRYSRSLASIYVVPVGGVQITLQRADTQGWRARVSHPETTMVCLFGRTAREVPRQLEPASVTRFCSAEE